MRANIFVTGFSGTGKTAVGRAVARAKGWRFVDMDEEISSAAGKSIEAIFRDEGESTFRALESRTLARVCEAERQVVSTGGGVGADDANRALMQKNGIVVCLEATPETIHARLSAEQESEAGAVIRPMLDDPDPVGRIVALKAERQPGYSLADWTVHTDRMTPEEAAAEVVRGWEALRRQPSPESSRVEGGEGDLAATVSTPSGDYPVWVGWGALAELGERARATVAPGAAYIVTDDGAQRHARAAQASLEAAGVPAHLFVMESGETSKTLDTARLIYEWLASRRAERGHLLVAVGGGVVGDLAGFVAATFLRGIHLAQVPTSLLAMMDAAIGGKTGVDLPEGKNLVGAFHQPRFVLEDVQTLQSLPERERTSGWAEAIKHGLILDEALLRTFEERREAVLSLDRQVSTDVVRRSVRVKADVVSRDEKETLGIRVLLNYGHTVGHALEAATGYKRYLHGEAVAVGMMAAATIGNRLGLTPDADVQRQRAVLEAYGLPVALEDVDVAAVKEAMTLDKKTSAGSIRWVLLEGIGRAVTRSDVPDAVVDGALRDLMGG